MVADNKKDRGLDLLNDDIVLQILSIANGGASISEIRSRITNPPQQDVLLNEYLAQLIKSGLIGYDDKDSNIYTTTDEGLRFLESYERVNTGTADHEPPKGLFHVD